MAFILGSFLIGLSTAYLMSRRWGGQGRFLAHTYSLLLCTIPLVTISGALLLIPATGSLVILLTSLVAALFVYRIVLHGCIIRGVHGLSALKATLVVLIFPLLFVGLGVGLGVLAFILLLIMLTEGVIFEVLGASTGFPLEKCFSICGRVRVRIERRRHRGRRGVETEQWAEAQKASFFIATSTLWLVWLLSS